MSSAFKNGPAVSLVLRAAPRDERRNFKADKQEVCIIPLVPEEGREGRERERQRQRQGRQEAGKLLPWASPMFKFSPRS